MRTETTTLSIVAYHDETFDDSWLERLQWQLKFNETVDRDIGLAALRKSMNQYPAQNPCNATWIIPAEQVLAASVVVPSDKPQHIRAAAPNLLEEWTASEIDDLHIAHGQRAATGELPLIALDRDFFATQLGALQGENFPCRQVFVDALLLPCAPQTLTLLLDRSRALLRWSTQHCGAIELEALEPLLKALLNADDIRHIHVLVTGTLDPKAQEFLRITLPHLQTAYSLRLEQETLDCSLLEFLCDRLACDEAAIDLRQGDFAPSPDGSAAWKRWRPVAYTAGVLLAAQLMVHVGLGLYLQNEANATRAASEALYRELFPNDKRLVNLEQQLQNQLGSLNGRKHKTFLELFAHLAQEIQHSAAEPPIQLRALTYDASNGVLQVDMNIANVESLDGLQKRLAARRLNVKVLSAAADADGAFVGRLSMAGS